MRTILAALFAALLLLAAPAHALPTPEFTADPVQTVGTAHTYDAAGSVCEVAPCTYTWRWYRPTTTTSYDRLGTTMGSGPVISYTFTTTGLKYVVLKVTNSNSTHGFRTLTKGVSVVP